MLNDRINNAQRKALVGVVSEVMEKKIQEAKDAEGELTSEITESVKAEIGIDTLNNQIDALENQITTLKEKRKQLGVNDFGRLIEGSKAKALVDKRLEGSISIHSLEMEKARIISSIWTATSFSEAKELVESVLK